ncbi:bifunctional GNAT family N-acetyltransferase/(deoxy)nucleoside triphosphate pyrophosphohydrolase [Elioraea sp.]|uniref:bifunctional GNAT family N-acetyltransferase/(deoxy)nucleoside triphosphate pyrophosphohydrolase n=1 Tax=Elioraea sp. TaxID=2185103 RepID=UPI0025C4A7A6|nr:bifunctional GNAT family N-acetyltransferase/(deoxy)nucleoside triphosphate pyrophosphohydrolase [Elioraea sp.]
MAATAADPETGLLTERLRLRPLGEEDAAPLHRLINDWEVARNLGPVPFPYQLENLATWIGRTAADREADRAFHFCITGREEEHPIGVIGLTRTERGTGRIGYWVGRRYWGHGVAGEALARVTSWALGTLGLDRLIAYVADDNAASMRVLEKEGFRFTHEAEHDFASRGGAFPVRWFALTRADRMAASGHGRAAPGLATLGDERKLLLVAAVALIDGDGRVLLARRPEGKALAGLWEFPGGKVQPGETPEAALIRELKEELGIDVSASCLGPFTFASHAYEKFHLMMPLYLCRRWQGTPTPLEGQALAWVRPNKLADYPMPPADIPLVAMLRDWL